MSSGDAKQRSTGEEKAWSILVTMSPEDVCKRALVSYDAPSGLYAVRSFGMEYHVSVQDQRISSLLSIGDILLTRLGDFFRLSLLWYLVDAKEIPFTGKLTKIEDIKDGLVFSKGSHTLPLGKLAAKYGINKEGFIKRGKDLGGETLDFGDASLMLLPFPRIPVTLVLWLADEEFPARADLMLDSSCDLHLATDMVWYIAMMSVLLMLF
jgi:hypothetical protein